MLHSGAMKTHTGGRLCVGQQIKIVGSGGRADPWVGRVGSNSTPTKVEALG